MSTRQPSWQLIANLGDVHPIDYGGYFVFRDTTGVYPAEVAVLEPQGDDDADGWEIYRFVLEKCTHVAGVLSDNRFHPELSAWFACDLHRVAESCDVTQDSLIALLCSESEIERAYGYGILGGFYGYHEFDHYPRKFSDRQSVEEWVAVHVSAPVCDETAHFRCEA